MKLLQTRYAIGYRYRFIILLEFVRCLEITLAVLNAGVCEVTFKQPLEVIRRLASAGWEIQNSIQER